MIVWESTNYVICKVRIEGLNLPFALDHKEKSDGVVCLVNVGWYPSLDRALDAKLTHSAGKFLTTAIESEASDGRQS